MSIRGVVIVTQLTYYSIFVMKYLSFDRIEIYEIVIECSQREKALLNGVCLANGSFNI